MHTISFRNICLRNLATTLKLIQLRKHVIHKVSTLLEKKNLSSYNSNELFLMHMR